MKKLDQIKAYPKYRRMHSIAYLIFGICCALIVLSFVLSFVWGRDNSVTSILAYVAIAGVIIFYVMNFLYWRCPNCNKTLPLFGPVPVCHFCKHQFMDKHGEFHW